MAAKFELKKTPKGKFMFNLKAGNGQVILTSEMYESKAAAQNGIKSVRKNCSNDKCFDRKTAKSGQPYFTMKSTNGQNIGKSQMYKSASGMRNGIDSIKRNAADANLSDLTS